MRDDFQALPPVPPAPERLPAYGFAEVNLRKPEKERSGWRLVGLAVGVGILALLGIGLLWHMTTVRPPVTVKAGLPPLAVPAAAPALPKPFQVRRMEAYIGSSRRDLLATGRFQVPEKHIPKLLTILGDFRRDPEEERRMRRAFGTLWLHCDDGKTVEVWLSVGFGRGGCVYCLDGLGGKCYSGSSDQEVEDAIRAAYADTTDALQGTWFGDSYEENGNKPAPASDMKLVVTGKTYIIQNKQDQVAAGTITFDPAKREFEMSDEKTGQHLGIYNLEDDTLKICYAPVGEGRPKGFETMLGSSQRLFVLKREPD
jgi:uncharacterized protein (TIGR03067 family)